MQYETVKKYPVKERQIRQGSLMRTRLQQHLLSRGIVT